MCCFYSFIPPLISVIMSCRLVVYRLLTIFCSSSCVALMVIGAFSTEVWVCIKTHRQSSTVSWSNATDRMAGVMIIRRHLM